MRTKPIIESGMNFGPSDNGFCFHIEESTTIKNINKNAKNAEGVQIAELLLLVLENEFPTVWIIEAKSSSPQPSNKIDFDSYIDKIRNKLSNSLSLFFALYLKRHPDSESELPENFQQTNISVASFNLVLIIKDHNEEWLPPLQDALKKSLKPTVKIWNLSPTSVKVVNDNGARELGLIQ